MDELDLRIRNQIYSSFVRDGAAPAGASLTAVELNELARRWWSTRLDPDWRPRPPSESQAILDELGLTGEFWQLR